MLCSYAGRVSGGEALQLGIDPVQIGIYDLRRNFHCEVSITVTSTTDDACRAKHPSFFPAPRGHTEERVGEKLDVTVEVVRQ
jgi:hypothetical protein